MPYCDDDTWFYNGQCMPFGCMFSTQQCSSDYTEEELVCDGDLVINHTKVHEFNCMDETGCDETTTDLYETVEDCNDYDGQLYHECGIEDERYKMSRFL